MFMKLKKYRPGPYGAVEPVKKKNAEEFYLLRYNAV
jgi:hypothetical protein